MTNLEFFTLEEFMETFPKFSGVPTSETFVDASLVLTFDYLFEIVESFE